MKLSTKSVSAVLWVGLGLLLGFDAIAASVTSLTTLSKNLTTSIESIGNLITAGSYISGICFCLGSIMKFKQHKDNPTQIPIGTPVSLLLIGAALIFFPFVLKIAAGGIFGTTSSFGASGTSAPI